MKKLLLLLLILGSVACNDSSVETERSSEEFSITTADTLSFLLSRTIPIEGGYSVAQQAKNYSVSEIQHREGGIFYIYVPEPGFTGTEQVKIKREDSNGAEVFSETITNVTIKVSE
ncbi:hypothetical protein [Salinimicrobium oceani]|uniref:DUF4377 domain-containing protein n=1 Tax=Salinimicrobium oceani TaxID=2722702 RepID=A0ABX1D0M0_9FLAO|nr:hypothetical protein [Salinimicrobium oceani]NJW53850.1 hypothetical protein [Salinimicrobium oceani]